MSLKSVTICISFGLFTTLHAQKKTLAEGLGYAKDSKLLIIHADDLGGYKL